MTGNNDIVNAGARAVVNLSGAGDTVVATLAAALAYLSVIAAYRGGIQVKN